MERRSIRDILGGFAAYYMLEGERPEARLRISRLDGATIEGYIRDDGEGGFVFTHDYSRVVPDSIAKIEVMGEALFDIARRTSETT